MTPTEGAATPLEAGPQRPTELEYANMRATEAERRAVRMEAEVEQDLAYLIRRNAYLEDVSDHQRARIDELEKRIEQIEQGLAETSHFCLDLRDEVQALLRGYRCAGPAPVAPEAAPKE